MSKTATITLVIEQTYSIEVDDDFDFDEDGYEFVSEFVADNEPDTEDWESIVIQEDESGDEYIL